MAVGEESIGINVEVGRGVAMETVIVGEGGDVAVGVDVGLDASLHAVMKMAQKMINKRCKARIFCCGMAPFPVVQNNNRYYGTDCYYGKVTLRGSLHQREERVTWGNSAESAYNNAPFQPRK